MYEAHDSFIQPEDEKIKVWRYTSFTKFVSLLDSQCLYFTRSDKFEDPFEGSLTKHSILERESTKKEIVRQIGKKAAGRFLEHMEEEAGRNENWRRYHAINCWHKGNHESAASSPAAAARAPGPSIESPQAVGA